MSNPINIEYALINSILLLFENKKNEEAKKLVDSLSPDHFKIEACKEIITVIKKIINENNIVSFLTITFEIDVKYRDIMNEIVACDVNYLDSDKYKNELLMNFRKNKIIKEINDKSNENSKNSLEVMGIDELIQEVTRDLEIRSREESISEAEKWKTGIRGLNEVTGCLKKSQLILIGGNSGDGKTSLGLQILLNLSKKGIKAYIVSKEMDNKELILRMISQNKLIDSNEFKDMSYAKNYSSDLEEAYRDLKNLGIIFDKKSQTISDIRKNIIKNKPEIILVDYLQIIKPENTGISREQQVASISSGLKNIAKEENVCIILLAQLNENQENGNPSQSSIRESRGPYLDSDIVIFIKKVAPSEIEAVLKKSNKSNIDKKYIYSSRAVGYDFVKIIVAKNRNGSNGEFYALNRKPYYLFNTLIV